MSTYAACFSKSHILERILLFTSRTPSWLRHSRWCSAIMSLRNSSTSFSQPAQGAAGATAALLICRTERLRAKARVIKRLEKKLKGQNANKKEPKLKRRLEPERLRFGLSPGGRRRTKETQHSKRRVFYKEKQRKPKDPREACTRRPSGCETDLIH